MNTSTLVVGATGLLGSQLVRLLRLSSRPVRALVRESAQPTNRLALEAAGAQPVSADLKDRASLDPICRGVSVVVSTASATMSRQVGDSISSVDDEGQCGLVDSAERSGVEHFVFVSFPPIAIDFALQRAKRHVEERLRKSRMSFTIVQAAYFTEAWLGPALGFDPAHGSARILGEGTRPVNWVSLQDVARFTARACDPGVFARQTCVLGGPDALTPLEVVKIFEDLGGPPVKLSRVAESELEAHLVASRDPIEEAYAALMLGVARGLVVESTAWDLMPERRISVREYAAQMLGNKRY